MSTHSTDAPDSGPVPEENLPGHHPTVEQDKPDLDDFAAKLGVAPEAEVEHATTAPDVLQVVTPLAPPPTAADASVTAELGVMAPVAEVREAVRAYVEASVRLFLVTPVKVGWFVGETAARRLVRQLR